MARRKLASHVLTLQTKQRNTRNLRRNTDNTDISDKNDASPTPIGREVEFDQIYRKLSTFVRTGEPTVLYITGVPGSGKTHTVEKVLQALSGDSHGGAAHSLATAAMSVSNSKSTATKSTRQPNNKLSIAYVNCTILSSGKQVFGEILARFSMCSRKGRRTSTGYVQRQAAIQPTARARVAPEALRAHISSCPARHLIILDEVDFFPTQRENVLYNILELQNLPNAHVAVVCLSNTLNSLSTRIESRIGPNRLEFYPYTATQLATIAQRVCQSGSAGSEARSTTSESRWLDASKENGNVAGNAQPISPLALSFATKKIAASTGDIRRLFNALERTKEADGASHNSIASMSTALTALEGNIINRFIPCLTYLHWIVLHTNIAGTLTMADWRAATQSFCRLRNIHSPDAATFTQLANELCTFGFFKYQKGVFISEYLEEELAEILDGLLHNL